VSIRRRSTAESPIGSRGGPRPDAEFVANDLREEFDDRHVSWASPRGAFWTETLRSLLPLLARRWTSPVTSSARDRQGDAVMNSILDDVRYAARLARRTPLASLAVIATMVLGIGSTTAVFSAMNAVLLKPLPFPESSRVVRLKGVVRNGLEIEVSRIDLMVPPDGAGLRSHIVSAAGADAAARIRSATPAHDPGR
jgi:hypothetical protein